MSHLRLSCWGYRRCGRERGCRHGCGLGWDCESNNGGCGGCGGGGGGDGRCAIRRTAAGGGQSSRLGCARRCWSGRTTRPTARFSGCWDGRCRSATANSTDRFTCRSTRQTYRRAGGRCARARADIMMFTSTAFPPFCVRLADIALLLLCGAQVKRLVAAAARAGLRWGQDVKLHRYTESDMAAHYPALSEVAPALSTIHIAIFPAATHRGDSMAHDYWQLEGGGPISGS